MGDQEDSVAPSAATWRASLLARRPVVDVRRVEQIGYVADVVFDPRSCQLDGLLVQRVGQEGHLIEVARRALGGAIGLVFVPIEQVMALHADVVTIDPAQLVTDRSVRTASLPCVSTSLGFAVVTIRGQRLGRLVDLLLDGEGRCLAGYLVEPGGYGITPSRGPERRPWQATRASTAAPLSTSAIAPTPQREGTTGEPPAGATRPTEAAQAPFAMAMVVPASPNVRVGRNLVIVAEDGSSQSHQLDTLLYGPPAWTGEADQATRSETSPAWYNDTSDAPTQHWRH